MGHPSDIAFSPAVKAAQERHGSRGIYENPRGAGWDTALTPARAAFIEQRDSFYMATASEDGRPYMQHRGGPQGFLKILDQETLAFADFTGNRQYISEGNLSENDRVCLFLMDYVGRARLKIWGRAKVVHDPDEALLSQVRDPDYKAKIEHIVVITVEVMDGNCPQHITPRYKGTDDALTDCECCGPGTA